jgi:uncharacterized protein (DUF58 family)
MSSKTRYLQGITWLALSLTLLAFSEYLLFFDILLLFLWLNYYMQAKALQSIQFERKINPSRLFENESFTLELLWENPSPHSLLLRVQPSDHKVGLEKAELNIFMKARSKGKVTLQGSFFHYGKGTLGKLRLFLDHPLALYHLQRRLSFEEDIRVFPRLPGLEFLKEALQIPLPSRKTSSRLLEDTSDLLKVRPYERESWNRIHWKLSAKLDQWMVKEFSFTASGAVYLLLDLNRPASIYAKEVWSRYRKEYERFAIEAAARILWSIRAQGLPLSLFCSGKDYYFHPLSKRDPVLDLEELILQQGTDDPRQSILEAFQSTDTRLRPNDTLLLLTMHLEQNQLPQLIALRSRCAKVMALLFPYGFRNEEGIAGEDLLSVHPDAQELLNMAAELSSHHIHLRFVSHQQTLQEGIHAFP